MKTEAFVFALIVALLWGIAPLLDKKGVGNLNPIIAAFYRSLGAIIFLVIISLVMFYRKEITLSDFTNYKSISLILLSGVLAGALANFFYYLVLKMTKASKVVPIVAIFPLITVLLAFIFLGEKIEIKTIFGTIAIILGVILIRG